jgi:hypothetical protein
VYHYSFPLKLNSVLAGMLMILLLRERVTLKGAAEGPAELLRVNCYRVGTIITRDKRIQSSTFDRDNTPNSESAQHVHRERRAPSLFGGQ